MQLPAHTVKHGGLVFVAIWLASRLILWHHQLCLHVCTCHSLTTHANINRRRMPTEDVQVTPNELHTQVTYQHVWCCYPGTGGRSVHPLAPLQAWPYACTQREGSTEQAPESAQHLKSSPLYSQLPLAAKNLDNTTEKQYISCT